MPPTSCDNITLEAFGIISHSNLLVVVVVVVVVVSNPNDSLLFGILYIFY